MTDRFAVIWTRISGAPIKMGNLVATARECRFTYDSAFVDSGLPGFSLIAPAARLGISPLIHISTERFPLHPRLMVMIPPNTPGNLQRRVYSEILAKGSSPPAPGFETEWAILMLAGRDGIGHLDVFPSDTEAVSWYSKRDKMNSVLGGRSGIWRLLKDEISQSGSIDADTAQELAQIMGPTPTVGGMTTKLLAAAVAEGVAFVESATAGLVALLQAWPLREGARVGVAGSEWGPNLDLLDHRGLRPLALATDDRGVLDLEALEQQLRNDPPDLVLLDHVAAHRGLVQPAADVVRLCRSVGVPLWIDAAQSAGHVAIPAGADAVFATSRKWLTGPRGVGMVAVAPESRDQLRVAPLGKKPGASPMQLMESDEAHVAGRVGLGVAVREQLDLGLAAVSTRLVEVGQQLREAVANMPGWEVLQPDAPAGAITALMATAGQDVAQVQRGLLEQHRIVTTLALPWRAPRESGGTRPPLLRLSPHVDLDGAGLERLAGALLG